MRADMDCIVIKYWRPAYKGEKLLFVILNAGYECTLVYGFMDFINGYVLLTIKEIWKI